MWWIIIELLLTIKAVESQEYVRRGQNLEEFPTDIPNTTVSIDISYNSIETVNTDVLSSIVNLERLILRLNKINIFPNLSANGKTLKELNLYYNQILTVPDELLVVLPKLTKIDLEWNNLIEMPDFTSIPALTSLKLSNNKLKKIKSLTLPPSLKILELKHTPLRSLPKLRNLPLLETLDLLDTKKLFLSRDYFKDVPLFPLEDLSIGGGFKMKRMDLPDISDFGATLEKLDIQKLEIPAMPHSVFSFLTSVFSLVVNGGKYPFLPTTCPSEQENLKYEIVRSYTSRNTQLDLCDPRNLWFINHKELLDGELAMVECGNTSMVTQKIIDQYTLPGESPITVYTYVILS